MKSVIGERGQVTIPKRLRERLGLRSGDAVEFRELDDGIQLLKASGDDRFDRLFGKYTMDVSTEEFIEASRGPAP